VFADGAVVETGELVPAVDVLGQLGTVPGLFKVLNRLGYDDGASRGQVAAAAEFTLEGLHLTRRLDKETVAGRTVYGGS
jgi:magnesium chelatase subunit I